MARTNSVNFTGPLQYPMASAATDVFHKEDVQVLAQAVDQHDHTAGKGVSVAPANASVTNAKLASDTARANLLTNGGFEIWQRGNGPFTTDSAYIADRWRLYLPIGTISVSRDAANADTSGYCAAVTVTGGASAGTPQQIYQYPWATSDGISVLPGMTVSYSMRVKTSVANGCRVSLLAAGGVRAYSAYHTGNGAYQTLTVAGYSVPAGTANPVLSVEVDFEAAGTYYVDRAMLVVGSVPADYAPLHPADDLARCLRYYEASTGGAVVSAIATAASQSVFVAAEYKATKPVMPTVTFDGYVNVNAVNVTVNLIGQANVRLGSSSSGAGPFYSIANLYVEANP